MGDFFSKAIFFRFSVALIIGILCFEILKFPFIFLIFLLFLSIALMLFFFSRKTVKARYKFDLLFGIGILLFMVCVGFFRTWQNTENQQFNHNGEYGVYQITLNDFPTEKANSVLIYATATTFSDSAKTENISANIVLYLQKDSSALSLKSGDKLLITTILSLPKNKGNPNEFDYGKYLLRKNIVASGYAASENWQKIGEEKTFSLLRIAQRCRIQLLDIYRNLHISGDEFGITAALTLGYTDALTPELRESFSTTGASHVLAVSGLHVGVIYIVLNFLLAFLDKKERTKRIKPVLIILFLWFYAFITGLCPSVCRSALMFSLFAFGQLLGRKPYTYNTIFASAFILLLIKPLWLFEVGFQLSYSAVLAIIYFQPKIAKMLIINNKPLNWAWELTSVSIAAQLGAAPLCFYYFHQFPTYFLLSNFVGVPLASVIIYNAVALFAVCKIPFLNEITAFILTWVVKIMYAGLQLIENLPFALGIGWLNAWQTVLLYGLILTFGFLFYKIKFKYLAFFGIFSILLISTILIHNIENQRFNQLTIFNDNRNFTLNIVDNNQNFVYSSDFESAEKTAKAFWLNNSCKTPVFEAIDTTEFAKIIQFNNKNFIILTNKNIFKKLPESPLEVDYLVVNKNIFPSNVLFEKYFVPKVLITAGDVYESSNKKYADLTKENGILFYPVREKGAFILRK